MTTTIADFKHALAAAGLTQSIERAPQGSPNDPARVFVEAFADLMRAQAGVLEVRVTEPVLESGRPPFRRVKVFTDFKPSAVHSPMSVATSGGRHWWEYFFGRFNVSVCDRYGSGNGLFARCTPADRSALLRLASSS